MKIVVVIPTYNESQNVGKIIDSLAEEFKAIPNHECHILIVDGNSPDGTGQIVIQKSQQLGFVHLLLEKEKAGLGSAYLYGFKHAINELKAEVLIEMDADFQHDPKDVKRLIAEIDGGYDYVIGSRFVNGGTIPQDWAFYRKFLSIGGNIFSRLVLGIFNISDFTSGFKASRVQGFVNKIDFDTLMSRGFAYKIDLLNKMYRLGAKIKEVPIAFGIRDRGVSKMESNNFMDSLKVVLLIRYRESQRFIKFAVVGGIGLVVDTLGFNSFRVSLLPSSWAALLSGFIAMMTTFLLNNYWSFKDAKIESFAKKVKGFLFYVCSSFVPIVIRSKLVFFAVAWFGDNFVSTNSAFFIGIIFGLVWNYIVYSKIIWKKR